MHSSPSPSRLQPARAGCGLGIKMGRGGGKKQHSKDKMYLLQSEWQHEGMGGGGGYRGKGGQRATLPFRRLPFSCCALSLQPFHDPMMTPKGVVYDMLNIVPYMSKNKKCPVTGAPMTLKELTKLTFHKNDKDEYHCPIMFKVFTPHTRIIAIKTSGHVYCFEAIDQLCYKTKNLRDLLTDQVLCATGQLRVLLMAGARSVECTGSLMKVPPLQSISPLPRPT